MRCGEQALARTPERYLFEPAARHGPAAIGGAGLRTVCRLAAAIAEHAFEIGLAEQDAQLLARMRSHDLRAARNTHLLNARRDARLVQRFMRHTDINTTLLYDHTVDADAHAGCFLAMALHACKSNRNVRDWSPGPGSWGDWSVADEVACQCACSQPRRSCPPLPWTNV